MGTLIAGILFLDLVTVLFSLQQKYIIKIIKITATGIQETSIMRVKSKLDSG